MCRSSGPTAPVAPSERLDDVRAVDCGGAGLAELTGRQLHGDDPAVGDRAAGQVHAAGKALAAEDARPLADHHRCDQEPVDVDQRSEEHTSELQSRGHLVCRLLLEKKKYITTKRKK